MDTIRNDLINVTHGIPVYPTDIFIRNPCQQLIVNKTTDFFGTIGDAAAVIPVVHQDNILTHDLYGDDRRGGPLAIGG
jgi:hypothetical protein